MKSHHRLMLLISSILIISFVTSGTVIRTSITYVSSKKHEQTLAADARSYVYLVQDNEIDRVEKIAKQQNIDLLITKHDKKVFSSDKLKVIPDSDSYIQKRGVSIFNEKVNDYHVWAKGYDNDITEMYWMLWRYLTLTCLVVLVCLHFISRSFERTLVRPIQEVTYVTQLLVNGYYHIRVPKSNVVGTKTSSVSTSDLTRRFQRLNNE